MTHRRSLAALALMAVLAPQGWGTVVDDAAGLLNADQRQRIEQAVQRSGAEVEVRIERAQRSHDLRQEGDAMVEGKGRDAFAIVVTLEPRQWRISKSPSNPVGETEILDVGEYELVPRLQEGRYELGLVNSIRALGDAVQGRHYQRPWSRHVDVLETVALGVILVVGLSIFVFRWGDGIGRRRFGPRRTTDVWLDTDFGGAGGSDGSGGSSDAGGAGGSW